MIDFHYNQTMSNIIPNKKEKFTKKEVMESLKINEDDYCHVLFNVFPEMDLKFDFEISKQFGINKKELIDATNVDICYKYFVVKFDQVDFRKNLNSMNILNATISDLVYYTGTDMKRQFELLCKLNDFELNHILQSYIIRFYQLMTYMIGKQIKMHGINPEFFNSQFVDSEYILFIKFMLDHGMFDVNTKRLDFVSDINKFFKIKSIDYINTSKIRGRDDVLKIVISKMFRILFYNSLSELNLYNKEVEVAEVRTTYAIIDDLYNYFYTKVYVNPDECIGEVDFHEEVEDE